MWWDGVRGGNWGIVVGGGRWGARRRLGSGDMIVEGCRRLGARKRLGARRRLYKAGSKAVEGCRGARLVT
jgi:hypothetical protein